MKIAVSGAHRVGKTTLVEALSLALPTYTVVEEPYYLLEEEGHRFAEMASVEDFELQLERSIESIVGTAKDGIFDRCPLDFLAYLFAHPHARRFIEAPLLPSVRMAVEQLDLIVFVPVEEPDRIVPDSERPGLRRRMDEQLRKLLYEDPWDLEHTFVEVGGTSDERTRQVLAHLRSMAL